MASIDDISDLKKEISNIRMEMRRNQHNSYYDCKIFLYRAGIVAWVAIAAIVIGIYYPEIISYI